jgi:hypothetical protein
VLWPVVAVQIDEGKMGGSTVTVVADEEQSARLLEIARRPPLVARVDESLDHVADPGDVAGTAASERSARSKNGAKPARSRRTAPVFLTCGK